MPGYKKLHDRRGQIGATLTWLVAVIIIVAALIIFVAISLLLAKVKAVSVGDVRTDSGSSEQLAMKTTLAEQLTNNRDKQKIEEVLKEQNAE